MKDMRRATCHCGAVELRVRLSEPLSQAARCDCSFCRRRGAAAVTAARDAVEVVKGADQLTLYQFGTRTARHHFCRICGIYMYHNRRSNPDEVGVNVYTLDGVLPGDLEPLGWSDGINHPSDR